MQRRRFIATGTWVLSSAAFARVERAARAAGLDEVCKPWLATPPAGFLPLRLPGRVVKVEKGGDFISLMQPNQLWPRPEVAERFLEAALTRLTGAPDLVSAIGKFIHPRDIVALKINGIAGQVGKTMAFNAELALPLVRALIELGVAAENITVFEQFPKFLDGTRINAPGTELPVGVVAASHVNRDVRMPEVAVFNRVKTRFVRQVTDATAVINLTMMKDHSLCGFTGALKNMTHGQIVNPQEHHAHGCDPQIPVLYAHPVLQSRVRLHIVDAFKIIYDRGPLDTDPKRRIPHGCVYASTDAVALDTVGHRVIDDARVANRLPTLLQSRREPTYIRTAAELGLGIGDWNAIDLRTVGL